MMDENGDRICTSDKNISDGYGYFKHNSSLNCGCRQCKARTKWKRNQRRAERHRSKRYVVGKRKNENESRVVKNIYRKSE